MEKKIVGYHYLVELYECPFSLLNNEDIFCQALTEATKKANNTLLKFYAHKFEPQGVTAIALLGESHLSIHTWPETGYAAVDIFTCGTNSDPKKAVDYLVDFFKAKKYFVKIIERGNSDGLP